MAELLPLKKITVQTDDVYGRILNCSEGNGKLSLPLEKSRNSFFQKLRSLPLEKAIYMCFCPLVICMAVRGTARSFRRLNNEFIRIKASSRFKTERQL